jgi:hypothetical protein
MARDDITTFTKHLQKSQAVQFRVGFAMPIIAILFVLVCLLPFASATPNLNAAVPAQAPEGQIKMSLRPLYGGFYQDGKWTAIEVTIDNQTDNPWTGELKAVLPINANSAESTFAKYVAVGAKTTERFNFYLLPTQRPNTPVPIVLYDSQQRELARENVRLQLYATSDYIVGYLADESVPLTFPRVTSVTIKASSFRLIPFKLEPKSLNDRQETLDSLNLIIVGDLSPDKLNDEQRQALFSWINNGGQLIFAGTPKLAGNILAITAENLAGLSPVQVSGQTDVDRLNLRSINLENNFLINLPQPTTFNRLVPTKNAFVSLQQFEENLPPVMVTRSFGRGSISVLAVDPLGAAFSSGNFLRNWWSQVIDSGLSVFDYSWINQNLFSQNGISNILLNLPAPNQPNPALFLLAIGAYIFLVVPVTYFGLKRVEKVQLAWAVIPGLAVVFGLSLLWAVSFLPVGDVYLSRINLLMANEDETPVSMESFVLVSSANEDPYKLTFDSAKTLVRPQFLSANSPSQSAALPPDIILQNDHAGNTVIRSTSEGRGRLQVFGAEGWQNLNTPIETNLQFQEDDTIVGTVINKSPLTIRDAVLVFGDNYLPLGDWSPGEEKRVNFLLRLKPNFMPRSNIDPALYRMPNSVASLSYNTPTPIAQFTPLPTPGAAFSPGEGATGEKQLANVKWMILNSAYLNGRFGASYRVNNLYLAGWLDEDIIKTPLSMAERRSVQQDLTLLIKPLQINYGAENGKVTVPPHSMLVDRIVDMSRSTLGGYNLANNQQMVLQYRLPGELSTPKFQPTVISVGLNAYREQDRRSIVPNNIWRGRWADPIEAGSFQNNPKVELWNWETGTWESVASQGDNRARIDISRPDLGAFVFPGSGYIRVRLSVANETIFLGQVSLAIKGNYQP